MTFYEGDLVCIYIQNTGNGMPATEPFKTWVRVKFIDNDGTFIGLIEKTRKIWFDKYKIGATLTVDCDMVTDVFQEHYQFCYSDGVTICTCPALCREK